VFDWRPGGEASELDGLVAELAAEVSGPVEAALCPHPGGAPTCWCRPPLPGLAIAFARRRGVDPARSIVVGASAAHRTLAATLGARLVEMGSRPDGA
jgi:histidinol phosphatase-like enzyme